MDPKLRAAFNADFTPEKYAALVRCVNETEKWPADFRISETPIFLTREFTDEITRAATEIIDMFRQVGLEFVSAWGWFDGTDYDLDSRRMILMARRPAGPASRDV